MTQAYCVKCNHYREKGEWQQTELLNEQEETRQTKTGTKKIIRGTCGNCGSTVTKIIGKKKEEEKCSSAKSVSQEKISE